MTLDTAKIHFRHRLEYALFRTFDGILAALPWSLIWTLGEMVGLLFWALDARHRRVVRHNLRSSNLSLTSEQIDGLTRHAFTHYGSFFLSLIKLRHASREELQQWVHIEGLEYFDEAQREGKGFIQLTGHYGHWEAIALAQSAEGRSLDVIGRALDNPLLEKISLDFRTRMGNRVILKDGALRESIKALKEGRGVGFLLDQDGLGGGIFVEFLGQWASTHPSAGALVAKYQIPILPVFSWMDRGRVHVQFQPLVRIASSGDADRDTWVATQVMTRLLEAQIHRDPRWWFWLHNRFKTRPNPQDSGLSPLPAKEWVELSKSI
jgi:KDO2-lipid IV(A) lauroyltransferase